MTTTLRNSTGISGRILFVGFIELGLGERSAEVARGGGCRVDDG